MAILNGTSGRDTLAGTSAADTITGLEGADFIDGRAGADRMEGGAGNDVYVADNIGDAIIERPGEGVDEVRTTLQTYVLGANVETLSYTGTVGSFTGVGNELVNIITGGAAADLLDGGAGGDRLIGGLGNDTYVVDDRNDRLFEGTEGGIDTAWSHLAGYALAANVEILVGRLQTGQRLVGNTLENEIYGQSGRDLLDGAAGADRMTGGAGNDTYVVDNADDSVVELAREGVDTVLSSVSYRLADYVECLTLTGGSKISATGNSASNILTGNAAANTLDGGTGADRMSGGAGNDTYVVDNVSDRITELAGEGVDTVLSSVSYTLGDYVERLALTGEAAANGTGNGASNVLTGNAAANTLSGGAGNDRIHTASAMTASMAAREATISISTPRSTPPAMSTGFSISIPTTRSCSAARSSPRSATPLRSPPRPSPPAPRRRMPTTASSTTRRRAISSTMPTAPGRRRPFSSPSSLRAPRSPASISRPSAEGA